MCPGSDGVKRRSKLVPEAAPERKKSEEKTASPRIFLRGEESYHVQGGKSQTGQVLVKKRNPQEREASARRVAVCQPEDLWHQGGVKVKKQRLTGAATYLRETQQTEEEEPKGTLESCSSPGGPFPSGKCYVRWVLRDKRSSESIAGKKRPRKRAPDMFLYR